jgi:hypothetical protein
MREGGEGSIWGSVQILANMVATRQCGTMFVGIAVRIHDRDLWREILEAVAVANGKDKQ